MSISFVENTSRSSFSIPAWDRYQYWSSSFHHTSSYWMSYNMAANPDTHEEKCLKYMKDYKKHKENENVIDFEGCILSQRNSINNHLA